MSKIKHFGFNPKNYKLLITGLIINVLGFILMIGGGSADPNSFNADELFSPIRITLAPFFIVLGYVVIFYSIMKKDKEEAPKEKNPSEKSGKVRN
jgi:uncharacterized membrane protein